MASGTPWLLTAARAWFGESILVGVVIASDDPVREQWGILEEALGARAKELPSAVADFLGVPTADLAGVDGDAARELPEDVSRSRHVLVTRHGEGMVEIACCDPTDMGLADELATLLGLRVELAVASPARIETLMDDIYAAEQRSEWGRIATETLAEDLVLHRTDGQSVQAASSATHTLLRELLRTGVESGASDTHIQPYRDAAVVRNRIDGVLRRSVELPSEVHQHLIRHVKAIANMDPTRRFTPQDGELRMELQHRAVDLRISILPVDAGERLVLRYLYQNQIRSLRALGLPDMERERLSAMTQLSAGMVLMTGPTGSGKTSLLYAMLAAINEPEINVMTVEEPVEYRLPGASQINIDPRTGLTFAAALRSILRQDPDVVMVGEIRDSETALIASQAALTGHFVLSTVHTLDALLSVVRMRDLGVSPSALAESLQAVVAQRLLRKLCMACAEEVPAGEDSRMERSLRGVLGDVPLKRAVGCSACEGMGYRGRMPVLEVIEITPSMRMRLREGEIDIEELERLAIEGGMRFLAQCAAQRVVDGETSVEELVRVCGAGVFGKLRRQQELTEALRRVTAASEHEAERARGGT